MCTNPRVGLGRDKQGGSALLLITLAISMLLGFLAMFLLAENQVQAGAARVRLSSLRAYHEAIGELERARMIIVQAPYDRLGRNTAVRQALDSASRRIAGTDVTVERLTGDGGSWYRLTSRVPYEGTERVVHRTFRDKDYFSSYCIFVSKNSLGIRGGKTGDIHTNKDLEFVYADGVYDSTITAVDGVTYRFGATPENTHISGGFNPHAERIDFSIDDYDGCNLPSIERKVDPRYRFPNDNDIKIKLKREGSSQILEVEIYTKPKPQFGGRQKIETRLLPAPPNGVIYAGGDIFGIEGDVVGRLTIATKGRIDITGNIVYRDAEGDPAYLNGTNPNAPYEANPDYDNQASLGLIAHGDVLFTRHVPQRFEMNGSLLSIEGRVGLEGLVQNGNGTLSAYNRFVDELGNPVSARFDKESIRILGGTSTARRPSTVVISGGSGAFLCGFRLGRTVFDPSVIEAPPPYFLARPEARFFAFELAK